MGWRSRTLNTSPATPEPTDTVKIQLLAWPAATRRSAPPPG